MAKVQVQHGTPAQQQATLQHALARARSGAAPGASDHSFRHRRTVADRGPAGLSKPLAMPWRRLDHAPVLPGAEHGPDR
ncbi:hypothetical protein LP419_12515 [Massilia sp. H-1]|nr:hypothetical protein LP419_12515 [Massilia sp. H-1]